MFPRCTRRRTRGCRQIDSLRGARPQDPRAHPDGRARSILRNPPGVQRHAQLAREVGADVGGDPRLDHADRARASACCPRSRRSRTLAPVSSRARSRRGRRRRQRRRVSTTAAPGSVPTECQSAVPHPARDSTTATAEFWTGGADGRAALLALPGLRLLHPPAAADLPDVPLEEPRSRSRCPAGRRCDVLGQPPALDAGTRAAVRASRSSRSSSRTSCG